nr:hypothetical protein [Leptospira borgpetersenii]
MSSSNEPVFDSFRRSIEIRFILKYVIYTVLLIPSKVSILPKHGQPHFESEDNLYLFDSVTTAYK